MKSPVIKRSIILDGHKTSISIEESFWVALKEIAHDSGTTLSKLVGSIRANRAAGSNLSSAIRVHILELFRAQLSNLESGAAASNTTPRALRPDMR
jgi:predicted DNA-binding ribbon-helix-helix protein